MTDRQQDHAAVLRRCYMCKEQKPLSFFGNGKSEYRCRPCRKISDRKRPKRSVGSNSSDAAKAKKVRYERTHRDLVKQAIRRKVRHAIASGRLSVPDGCEQCAETPTRSDGVRALQAHHDDYTKPLDVRWLCAKCHTAWHKVNDALPTPPQADTTGGQS